MKIATIANYGSEQGEVAFSVVTIHDADKVFCIRKYVCQEFADVGECAMAMVSFAQSQNVQEIHTVKDVIPAEEAYCFDCGELVGQISYLGLEL